MRTANPALNEKIFRDAAMAESGVETMTIGGTVNKTAILLFLVVIGAGITWRMFYAAVASFDIGAAESVEAGAAAAIGAGAAVVMPWLFVGLIGGLIFALITIFAKKWAMFTAPIYAILEGLLLGALSSFLETVYPGIVNQAVGLTFGTLYLILTIYKTGVIKVTDKFRLGVMAATGAIFLVYLATWILGFFGAGIPYIHGNGMIGIGFSLLVIVIATLNLVLDFDFIEKGSAMGAPKYMEWYAAFGLIVTLVWLYIEFLRLLSKLRSR